MATKRKAAAMAAAEEEEEPVDPSDELMFLCLGGGNEVGRSCHVIQYKGKTVMLDAGMHPAYDGLAALPFFDEFDLSTVDVLLITHFHIDHAAALPYVLSKTNFHGRVLMTHPTKAIYKWLIQDMVRVQNVYSSAEQRCQLFTEADHMATYPQIEAIDYHTTHTISGIRITPYPAGHVLGAAMYHVQIAGLNVLFTGDYSREDDRHLIPASIPRTLKIDVLITESTYGIASHIPRHEREAGFMKSVTGVLNRGGRVLMPVFALGRAQEILLILDEYWQRHTEYQRYPIYYASNLARKCLTTYQTYIGAMNNNIKRLLRERIAEAEAAGKDSSLVGPWDFRHIRSLRSLDRFDDMGGCVMLASPGMMQSGVSREMLERWAPDARNGVVITGYSIEGTMAKIIMQEPDQIQAVMTAGRSQARTGGGPRGGQREGEPVMIPRRCTVEEFQFAAHVDGTENREFIEEVSAPVIILVHGQKAAMMRLKSKLLSMNANRAAQWKVFTPANAEELRIPFRTDKMAKVVGKLAEVSPPAQPSDYTTQPSGPLISGVLVQNDFKMSLMAPEDLREYAGLTTTTITCKQRLTLATASTDLIRWALEGTFGGLNDVSAHNASNGTTNGIDTTMNGKEETADEEIDRHITSYEVMDCVIVHIHPGGAVEVEWEGNMMNDGIADAVLAILFSVETSPAAIKYSSHGHSHNHGGHEHTNGDTKTHELTIRKHNPHSHLTPEQRFQRLCMFLEAQFGEGVAPIAKPKLSHRSRARENGHEADDAVKAEEDEEDEEDDEEAEAAELARLHALGIPVPGIEIRVDKEVARVWLETLEVECAGPVSFRNRVQAVVERAVETVSPFYNGGG